MRPILVRRHLIDAVHWHDAVRTATADFTESGLGREKLQPTKATAVLEGNSDGAAGGN